MSKRFRSTEEKLVPKRALLVALGNHERLIINRNAAILEWRIDRNLTENHNILRTNVAPSEGDLLACYLHI